MSFCHVRCVLQSKLNAIASYSVQSVDFHQDRKWHEIGTLRLNKTAQSYIFEQADILASINFLPPHFYALDEFDRSSLLETEFKDYGWGAWSMTIHHYAQLLMDQSDFPEVIP